MKVEAQFYEGIFLLIEYAKCSSLIAALYGSEPQNIIHVGAHLGEEARAYAESGAKRIMWFEANPNITQHLLAELDRVGSVRHQVFPYALWSENQTLSFNVTNNLQSSSFLHLKKHEEYYPSIHVTDVMSLSVFSFDSLAKAASDTMIFLEPDFVNIDTQGAELPILKGMLAVLRSQSLKGIFLEVNFEELYSGVALIDEVDDFLGGFGFLRVATASTSQGWGDAFYLKSFASRVV